MDQNELEGVKKIVTLMSKAQNIGTKLGYTNLLQPGLVKELIIGSILGHAVHKTKHDADAFDPIDRTIEYEYLSCFEDGTFQLDRMFKSPEEEHQKSMRRITRNKYFYCAVFTRKNPLHVKAIYQVPVQAIYDETNRQLANSKNNISHVGFTIPWVKENGEKVYGE